MKIKQRNGDKTVITHLSIKTPISGGTAAGTCCVCGQETQCGFDVPFSDSFTGYSYLTHGDCVCPYCYTFFKDQNFRKKSWVATEGGVIFLKRNEIQNKILHPPEPPFVIYLTKGGQRQGWLSGLRLINYNKNNFYIHTDFVDITYISRYEAVEMSTLISALRIRKVSKTQLTTGEYTMYTYRKSVEEDWTHLIDTARAHKGKPLWEIMVYLDTTEVAKKGEAFRA